MTGLAWRVVATGAVFTAAAAATGCAAQSQPKAGAADTGYDGIYVAASAIKRGREAPDTAFENRDASGVYIRVAWNQLNPARGQYDWTSLDRELRRAVQNGKKISIGLRTGSSSPDWLYAAGVPGETFVSGAKGGRTGRCARERMPVPWSAGYMTAFGDVMQAMSTHIRQAGAYANVRVVRLTPMTARAEEMRIPSGTGENRRARAKGCDMGNSFALWQKHGYRPDTVVRAWQTMAQATSKAFPDKMLSVAVLRNNDFPSTDAQGRWVGKNGDGLVDVKDQILRWGGRAFPGRFMVQRNALSPSERNDGVLAEARGYGAKIGFQTNLWRGAGGGAGCGVKRGQRRVECGPDGYRALLNRGIELGTAYIEVWSADVERYPAQVAEADLAIRRADR